MKMSDRASGGRVRKRGADSFVACWRGRGLVKPGELAA